MQHLFVDMDDTLTFTDENLRSRITNGLIELNTADERLAFSLASEPNTNLLKIKDVLGDSTVGVGLALEEIIRKYGLIGGYYMHHAALNHSLSAYLVALHSKLKAQGIPTTFHICTHRGFSPNGKEFTIEYLQRHNLSHVFDSANVHALNPHTHNDKLNYIREVVRGERFVLIDDNPIYDKHSHPEQLDELLVCDMIYAGARYNNQNKFKTVLELHGHLKGLGFVKD